MDQISTRLSALHERLRNLADASLGVALISQTEQMTEQELLETIGLLEAQTDYIETL